MRDVRKVHNFLYTFAASVTDGGFDLALERYPGDDYTDVIGCEWFGDDTPEQQRRLFSFVSDAVRFSEARGKIPAVTAAAYQRDEQHIGLAHAPARWLHTQFLQPLRDHPVAGRIRFITFWRNEARRPQIYHLPTPGSAESENLCAVAQDSGYIFEGYNPYERTDDLPPRGVARGLNGDKADSNGEIVVSKSNPPPDVAEDTARPTAANHL